MALVNVRLDSEDARRAKALQQAGVPISRLLRDAIRSEYVRRIGKRRRGRPSLLVREIIAALPDPDDLQPRPFGLDDRTAVRRHIARKLAGQR